MLCPVAANVYKLAASLLPWLSFLNGCYAGFLINAHYHIHCVKSRLWIHSWRTNTRTHAVALRSAERKPIQSAAVIAVLSDGRCRCGALLSTRLHNDVSGPGVGAGHVLLVNGNRTRLRSKQHQRDDQARCYCSEAAKLYLSDPFYRQDKTACWSVHGPPGDPPGEKQLSAVKPNTFGGRPSTHVHQ